MMQVAGGSGGKLVEMPVETSSEQKKALFRREDSDATLLIGEEDYNALNTDERSYESGGFPELQITDHNALLADEMPYKLGAFPELQMTEALPSRGIYTYDFIAHFCLNPRKSPGHRISVDRIELGGKIFYPEDGENWEMAKVFVLHANFAFFVWFYHARIHFPLDSFNALARNMLPETSILKHLLEPHLRTHLEINAAVLYGSWTPLAGESHWSIFHKGGCPPLISGRAPLKWDQNLQYNRWLSAYYQVVLEFVQNIVLSSNQSYELDVVRFFDAVHKVSPFFPSGEEVKSDKELVAFSVANFIFAVSFWHSGDHASLREYAGNTSVVHRPRCPGPQESSLSKAQFEVMVQSWGDWYKQFMWSASFLDFIPNPLQDSTMIGVNYEFPAELQRHVVTFKQALRATEQKLLQEGVNVMPLDKVVRCIEF
ncbi:hypothetical protein HDU93_002434 [Gonapodya sp. JEL0774]|nr:hypothetical protein HDU93_002434 [Gonapodya sp. JEL0774]